MKYLISKICINADHIVCVEYTPEHPDKLIDSKVHPAKCVITLTSIYAQSISDDFSCPASEIVDLHGSEATRFWNEYIGDDTVAVSP